MLPKNRSPTRPNKVCPHVPPGIRSGLRSSRVRDDLECTAPERFGEVQAGSGLAATLLHHSNPISNFQEQTDDARYDLYGHCTQALRERIKCPHVGRALRSAAAHLCVTTLDIEFLAITDLRLLRCNDCDAAV